MKTKYIGPLIKKITSEYGKEIGGCALKLMNHLGIKEITHLGTISYKELSTVCKDLDQPIKTASALRKTLSLHYKKIKLKKDYPKKQPAFYDSTTNLIHVNNRVIKPSKARNAATPEELITIYNSFMAGSNIDQIVLETCRSKTTIENYLVIARLLKKKQNTPRGLKYPDNRKKRAKVGGAPPEDPLMQAIDYKSIDSLL